MKRSLLFTFLFALLLGSNTASAQYFGRNKPHYQDLDFKVVQTPNFEIYQYLNNPEVLQRIAAEAELWYSMHQAVLRDTFTEKNPIILYNDHAGFQQTNVIQGDISVGTGGVTEGLRNRVVIPLAMTNQQTNHVLGHELVHAFQYHMVIEGDSTSLRNLSNLPLWMVEGLAEYLSIGRVDAHTALWMRDAVLNDDLPTLRKLDNYNKYFPYRWGQAFWAYIAGTYGDEAIPVLFMNTAKYGLDPAIKITLFTTPDSLSADWRNSLKSHYGRWVTKGQKDKLVGKKLLSDDNAGQLNICPVLSPNGKYVIFLSEKNLFTTDLFLADARTGHILKKVASTATDGHIDQFNFIESAGSWSPNDQRFAYDVYEKGQSMLVIQDIFKGKAVEKIKLDGVPAFANPAWSPDGKTIVVSGLVNGQTDVYDLDLKTRKVRQLTNDRAAEILPTWNADGTQLAFSTDAISLERGRSNGAYTMNLAVMDMASGKVEQLDVFPGADNMNPQFDKNGDLLFLSDRDGFRNLYKYEKASKKVFQLTKLLTGITGITPYAPALTVAEDRDRILYTYYNHGEYVIYQAKSADFTPVEVDPLAVDMVPATLPPFDPRKRDIVNTALRTMDNTEKVVQANTTTKTVPYKPKFNLEYIGGGGGIGVTTGNSSFGAATGLAGGVDMLFGDILGNNQLYAGLALNGEITDMAGQFSYINNKNRIGWGLNLSHIPYRSGAYYQDASFVPHTVYTSDGTPFFGYKDSLILQRLFQERIGGLVFYPLSVTKRIELGGAFEFYHERVDYYNYYIDQYGILQGQERKRLPSAPGLNLANINAAFVGDNSYFGGTAPLQGWRYRIGLEQYFGAYKFSGLLLDGRRYFYVKPVSFAFRGIGYGRFGGNANNTDEVYPLFAGNPFFVRGYTYNFLYNEAPELVEQMAGSKIVIANAEVRLPFTGPRKLALLPINFLLTDLNLFFDAGLGFFEFSDLKPTGESPFFVQHKPLLSTGVSLRVNLFGALVLEPYWAYPISAPKEVRHGVWGFNILPGW